MIYSLLLMLAATAMALPQPDKNVKCPSGEELVLPGADP